jgi:hypothetical protein
MLTTGSKWFFGLGAVSFLLAIAYGYSTGGDLLGPFTGGYWGAVGDHLGYMVLVVTGLGAVFLGLMTLATRDASPSALAELAGTEQAPETLVPARAAYWPLVGAFGAALVVLGLVISNVLFIAGLFVLLGVLIEWTVLAWSDRATGDPDANHHLRNRIMAPFEVPLVGFLIVATVVASVSRLLLTSTEFGAVLVAALLATLILALGAIIAVQPKLSGNVVAGVLLVCGLGIVVIGVASAARGERFIEIHHEETSEEVPEYGPNIPAGTNVNLPPAAEDEEEG